jgi:hypothetical protein
MARKKKKKAPKFTPSKKDFEKLAKVNKSGQAFINYRIKKFNIDISSDVGIKKDMSSFKTRNEFNVYMERMGKLKNNANFKFKKFGDTVATQSQINQSKREMLGIEKSMKKVKGKKNTFVNKHDIEYTKEELFMENLRTNVARDMEKKRQATLSSLPKYNRKGDLLKKEVRPTEKATEVKVRQKFNPNKIYSKGQKEMRQEDLERVSSPDRYKKYEGLIKQNQMEKLMWAFGDDAEDVRAYFNKMSDREFENFYFMYKDSSMGFNEYDSEQMLGDSKEVDDKLNGVLERIRTDIQRYDKNREKYIMMKDADHWKPKPVKKKKL